jgi:hypothetical protein
MRAVLQQLGLPHTSQALLEAVLPCDPATWSEDTRARSKHITSGKEIFDTQKAALIHALMGDTVLWRALCRTVAVIGYQDSRCNGGGSTQASGSSSRSSTEADGEGEEL